MFSSTSVDITCYSIEVRLEQFMSNLQGSQPLQQTMQKHEDTVAPHIPWKLSHDEKTNYDMIFRSWDQDGTGFIGGQMAVELFNLSGLKQKDLAKIWELADVDRRGMLSLAEFHVTMGLIFRRLNGSEIPDVLPLELIPASARDPDAQISFLSDPSRVQRCGFNLSADLADIKRRLENTSKILDEADSRNREGENLEREMEDLKYQAQRIQDDMEYVSRGPRTEWKDEERRRLESELLKLMHECVPGVERKVEEREQREKDTDYVGARGQNRLDRSGDERRPLNWDDIYGHARDRECDVEHLRGTYNRIGSHGHAELDRPRSRNSDDRELPRPRNCPSPL